jgi:hypothetical protein
MTDELNAEDIQDGMYSADIDDPDYVPDEETDDKTVDDDQTDDKSTVDTDDKTEETDDNPDKITELETKLSEFEKALTEKDKEISRLGYALRKGEKKPEDKETPFTKAQLMQLYKEHADNPEVVFQVFEEMTKMGKVDAQVAAEKSVDIKTKKTEMTGFVSKVYPDAMKEGTDLYNGVQEAIEWAHLDGHPFADTLGLALLNLKNLPETIKKIKEEAKTEALKLSETDLKKKAEESRKKNINASKTGKTGKTSDSTKTVSLTDKEMDTAKRLGFTTKTQLAKYAKMIGKKSETMHAEA